MPKRKDPDASPEEIGAALQSAQHQAHHYRPAIPWALIGGLNLRARGVPRGTTDADILVAEGNLIALAKRLLAAGWLPVMWDPEDGRVITDALHVQKFKRDPVLADLAKPGKLPPPRHIIMMQTPEGMPADILGARHPFELRMIEERKPVDFGGATIPLAPLGGVLLAKMRADRKDGKDRRAIVDTAEWVSSKVMAEAIRWAYEEDGDTALKLERLVKDVRKRLQPNSQRRVR